MSRTLLPLLLLPALAACGSGTGPGDARLTLSFTSGAAAVPTASLLGATDPETFTDADANTLIIERVQIVLREIELERVEGGECAEGPDDDDCEEFEVGPVLIDLPLGGGVERRFAIDAPAGMYDELEFEIHKVSGDDEEDAVFRDAHPGFIGKSIEVEGTYNDVEFTYSTDLDVEQEHDLFPPLEIGTDGAGSNVTILVDLDTWFRVGGSLVNPNDANKGAAFESEVKENIKRSIEAFEDEDEDGDDD